MRRESAVVAWTNAQPPALIVTTAISVFEFWFGFHLLFDGARRTRLEAQFASVLALLGNRVLAFDAPAAEATAELQARRQHDGRKVELQDAQIAGIAIARRAMVATRNVRHFEDAGVRVLNPWS